MALLCEVGIPYSNMFFDVLTPKISGPFWWILGLKYVLIDMWANDQNEMMIFYFQQ
jgi:hypothetical protein